MIEPIDSLAFSIQSNRGVFAVLLGSGISQSARIPTGWDITLELARKLASVVGDDCGADVEAWYVSKFGKPLDYSDLLDALAKTQAERQQLLRGYFEATEAEREEGAKQPTAAHRAIAALAREGYIRVIITTNFDRLIESALSEEGVTPAVLSTPDQIAGAMPLIHTACCVIKVHGDYLDTRIRNTPDELAEYPSALNTLLDRVFDEFGLIICGWSANWDTALRTAITRAPSRRFSTYWASRSDPSSVSSELIARRGAQLVAIESADAFFSRLAEKVEALAVYNRPHPLSVNAAVSSIKRYAAEDKFRIQLHDLIWDEAVRAAKSLSQPEFIVQNEPINTENATKRVRRYQAQLEILMHMAVYAALWGKDSQNATLCQVLRHLYPTKARNGIVFWLDLQKYPSTLILYCTGIAALAAERYELIGKMFSNTLIHQGLNDLSAIQMLPALVLFEQKSSGKILEGMTDRRFPLSDWLHENLKDYLLPLFSDDEHYTRTFDAFEVLAALGWAFHEKRSKESYWAPTGSFGYRRQNRSRSIEMIEHSIQTLGNSSPIVMAGIFGNSVGACQEALALFKEFQAKIPTW